ncbi:MAG: hypothetical protein LBR46_01865 [Prevotella sp.]|jgi:hypothetical protein|nr:hypothetical protein [Prevotella sp.]
MEKLAKYTTVIYAIMWFIGFVSTYIYYYVFDINIVGYLDFSEILFMFFANILNPLILFKIILTLTGSLFILILLFRYSKKTPKFSNRILILTIIVFIVFIVVYSVLAVIGSEKTGYMNFSITIITFVYILKLYSDYGYHYYKKRRNIIFNFIRQIRYVSNFTLKRIRLAHLVIIISVSYTVYLTGYTSYTNAVKMKNINAKYVSDISFDYMGDTIKSDSTNTFVGSVRNYIFMYNKEKNSTNIYEKDNITNYKVFTQ